MKKAFLSGFLCLSITFASIVGISAAEEDQKATSDVSVSFEQPTGPIDPVDPEVPENPGPGPGPNGPLAILSVSDFNFGSGEIMSRTDFRPILTERPNLQVGDLRGALTGWKVSAVISTFQDKDGKDSLKGTRLHIHNGRMNSTADPIYAPVPQAVVLEPNEIEFVVKAEERKGGGIWVTRWYPENAADDPFIELEIPAGASTVGNHTATITWSLHDAP